MQRYFIYLQYDGTDYHGWQIQPNGNSVQAELQRVLTTLLRTETGRQDRRWRSCPQDGGSL